VQVQLDVNALQLGVQLVLPSISLQVAVAEANSPYLACRTGIWTWFDEQ
jgi:hypothetical protein